MAHIIILVDNSILTCILSERKKKERLAVSMSVLPSTLSESEYMVNPHTPRIGMTVRHRILISWNLFPRSVSGFTRQRGPEKMSMHDETNKIICAPNEDSGQTGRMGIRPV